MVRNHCNNYLIINVYIILCMFCLSVFCVFCFSFVLSQLSILVFVHILGCTFVQFNLLVPPFSLDKY